MNRLKGPSAPTLKRATNFISPKVEIVIACEGKNTEPRYLSDCIEGYGAGMVTLRVLPITGVPLTVVQAAIFERGVLVDKYNRTKNKFDKVFRVWAVFDRDEHPGVEEAIELAINSGVDVAFSDPCFEIWPLLHLIDYGAQDDRHSVQAQLSRQMPNYSHTNGAFIDFALIKNKFDDAYRRAEKHLLDREREGDQFGRPSTTVGRLVKKIIENGKKGSHSAVD